MSKAMNYRPKRGHRSKCCICWTWTFFAVLIVLVIAFVLGLTSMSLLRSTVPKITVVALSIPELELSSSSRQKPLTADFNITFEVTNKNDKAILNIRPLTVDISSENINLGHGKTQGFSLPTGKSNMMNAYTSVVKKNIGDSYSEQFQVNVKHKQIVVDIKLNGHMGIKAGGLTIKGLPMEVTCKGIYQAVFELGDGPKCAVKLFSFS